jgi:uncharacterized hydrophobic protein (TIGR00271 family)
MSDENLSARRQSIRFSRVLRLNWVVAIGASASVGLGVYLLLPQVMQLYTEKLAWQPYLMMAVLALPIVLTYAERAAVIPGSAGAYDFLRPGEFLWQAYLMGWIIVGGYICLIAALGWGVANYLDNFLQQFFNFSMDVRWIATGVIILVFLNSLVGMSIFWRTRSIIIYLSIAFLAIIFIRAFFISNPVTFPGAVVSRSHSPFYVTTLLLSGLWGLNFVLAVRDEVQRPTRAILPAMILILVLGAGLGILGALDFGRGLGTSQNAVFSTAVLSNKLVISGVYVALYIAFGLCINLLALNRALSSCLRVMDALSRDGFLPEKLPGAGRRVDFLPLLVVSLFSILLLWSAPVLTIVGLASLGLLWSTALMHAPDLLRSSPKLPENRTPRLPFHPLFPGLTVFISVLMPFSLQVETWWYLLAWAVLGVLYYLIYARQRSLAVHRQDVIVGELAEDQQEAQKYRVMVGVANPDTASALIQTGAQFARARDASLWVLRVLTLRDQVPAYLKQQVAQEEWRSLAEMVEAAGIQDVSVTPLVRLASNPAEGILAAINEERIDLLLVGWGSRQPTDDLRTDPVLSALIRYGACEVAILRGELPEHVKRVVVPSAGGPYAPTALLLGEDLIKHEAGEVALVHVVTSSLSPPREQEVMDELKQVQSSAKVGDRVKPQILESRSILSGILKKSEKADLLLVGASKGGLPERAYFGGLAVEVAKASQVPIVLVRGRETWHYPRLRYFLETLFDPFPTLTAQRRSEVIQSMREAAVPSFDYFILIVLSAVIASMGLLQNSAAVIIGAMLVAPLMSPILAVAMSMVLPDLRTLWTAAEATIKGVTLAIVVSIVMALISPLRDPTTEILARTQPNLLDLIVALASGAAAGYAIARKEVAAALPGVAIAAALVPPLGVVGYGIGTSQLNIASGALLLFITNLVAIIFAAALIFLGMGFSSMKANRGELIRGLQVTTILLVLVLALLGYTTIVTVRQLNREQRVKALFTESMVAKQLQVDSLEVTPKGAGFILNAKVISFEQDQLTFDDVKNLEQELSSDIGGPIAVYATVLSASRVELNHGVLSQETMLAQAFRQDVEARSARVVDLNVTKTDAGYKLEAALVLVDNSQLDAKIVDEIQARLSQLAGAEVAVQAVFLSGNAVEAGGVASPTPTPVVTPEPTTIP